MKRFVHSVVRPDDVSGYVAECTDIAVVTEGETLDEVVARLKEAVALYFDGEDVEALGFSKSLSLDVHIQVEPLRASA